jgi:endonuclease VIII-like 1
VVLFFNFINKMPELAEVKIMSEYINDVTKNKIFSGIRKNPVNKNPEVKVNYKNFTLTSDNRGKELRLKMVVHPLYAETIPRTLLCGMGMSGNWVFVKTGEEPKHTQLMFDTIDNHTLCLVDFRRFSRWKLLDPFICEWSSNRGPCMLTEWEDFVQNLNNSSDKKIFNKPIYELMMDQKYFNGCGNYLRAEIIDRADINPFMSAKEAIKNTLFLNLCRDIVSEAYKLGGGQLEQWTNPYFDDKITFKGWLQCYGKKEKIKDKNGRTFWFDKKFLVHS